MSTTQEPSRPFTMDFTTLLALASDLAPERDELEFAVRTLQAELAKPEVQRSLATLARCAKLVVTRLEQGTELKS